MATIFSYQANEEDKDANGSYSFEDDDDAFQLAAEPAGKYKTLHSRDSLESFLGDYNKEFATNYTTKDSHSFYNYYNDIAKRVKNKQIDILLVVNMFLTGFDSKTLNTLYVDKNLKYHGLIQAFSRTNRILNELKSQGNIICFRNLKEKTDEAITLFSNKDAVDVIVMEPYESYVDKFNEAVENLLELTPDVDSVNDLFGEDQEMEFAKAFRLLMRLKNVLNGFTQFDFEDLDIKEQTFEDFKSKYIDLHDKVRNQKEKVSILNDIDFELSLIHRDTINVQYILQLLIKLKDAAQSDVKDLEAQVFNMMNNEVQLRSKRELIEKFINEHLPLIEDSEAIQEEFEKYWNKERKAALAVLSEEEKLDQEKLENIIGDYLFTEKTPQRDDVVKIMNFRPALKERASTSERIITKIKDFVETFISGIAS